MSSLTKSVIPGTFVLGTSGNPAARHQQAFTFANGSRGVYGFEKPSAAGAGAEVEAAAGGAGAPSPAASLKRAPVEPFVPEKFKYSGQVLTFRGYFNEGVPESPSEAWRVRKLILRYFLEDNTLEAAEPAMRNDGLPHGKFLKRTAVPSLSGPEQLRVGGTVELFGKVLHITECDGFTRKFYEQRGEPQAPDADAPTDAFSATQAAAFARADPSAFHGTKSSSITRYIEAAAGKHRTFKKDTRGRYLAYDGLVLRFLLLWDDTVGNMFGERNVYWLSYYPASEEAEIKELKGHKVYMGWPTLLRRQRLPRSVIAHDDRMRSVEDVTGDEDYFNEDDFRVGTVLPVFGRPMLVCDVDDATQAFYLEAKGIDQRASRIDISEPAKPVPEVPVPPHIGIGSEEDTLESWKHLVPRKPKTDLAKLRNATGRCGKWLARLVTDDPVNRERVFRISYFVDDGEVGVFEPPVRNSGIVAGTWAKKSCMKNPATGDYFREEDFVVGQEVTIKGHRLLVFAIDTQPAEPVPDVDAIIATLKRKLTDASASLRKMFRKFDLDKSQALSFAEFSHMLSYYALGLSQPETITLFKAFEDRPGFLSYHRFMEAFSTADDRHDTGRVEGVAEVAVTLKRQASKEELDAMVAEATGAAKEAEFRYAQDMLCARLARQFKNSRTAQMVHANFRRFDINKDHLVSRAEFRQVLGAGGLYLSPGDIDMLLEKFYPEGQENASYEEFMRVIHDYADKVIRSQ